MRALIWVVIASGIGSTTAWAKSKDVPRGTIEVGQLHEELLARFPQWQGTKRADGKFTNPTLQVESNGSKVLLTLPEDADEAAVQAVIAAHTPTPSKRKTPTTLEDRVARVEQILGIE